MTRTTFGIKHIPHINITEESDEIPSNKDLNISLSRYDSRQKGGRIKAIEVLKSFLFDRSINYSKEISSPLYSSNSCSRLSTHIAFGNISIREIYQASKRRISQLKNSNDKENLRWSRSISSFLSRLRWHCHFIQKLEDQPSIEFINVHPAFNDLRIQEKNHEHMLAWKEGRTGYPMIDACMRSLISTGWLNFRMRAMLVSFVSNNLWMDWKEPSLYLARLFTDYEPGIHYNQIQMQSGTTGINAIRIYNPIKQSIDQDPKGIFIRKWVKELQDVSDDYIHSPWFENNCKHTYTNPIVDEVKSRKNASDILYGMRKNIIFKEVSKQIYLKHGSRKKK